MLVSIGRTGHGQTFLNAATLILHDPSCWQKSATATVDGHRSCFAPGSGLKQVVDSLERGYGISEETLKLMAQKKTVLVLMEESAHDSLLPVIEQVAKLWELPRNEEQMRAYKLARQRRARMAFELRVSVVFGSDSYLKCRIVFAQSWTL